MGRAVHFYRTLGFRLLYGGEDAAFTSFGSAPAISTSSSIGFGRWPRPVWGRVVFWVADVDAVYQRARDAGFDLQTEPADAPWGERYFHVRDPDGHELSFARPLASSGPAGNSTPEPR